MKRPEKAPKSVRGGRNRSPTAGNPPPTSPAPGKLRWQLAADAIEDAIRRGEYAEGARLPSESTIADQTGVNRHTVRRAIAELQRRSVLRPNPRGGALVAPRRLSLTLNSTERFQDILQRAGLRSQGRVLGSREEAKPGPEEVCRELKRPSHSTLVVLDHLVTTNDLPFALITTWAPADRLRRLPEVYALTGHLERALQQLGVTGYRRNKAIISCHKAEAAEIEHLGLAPGDIVIALKLVYVDGSGEPVCYSHFRYAAERMEFVVYP